MTTNTLRKDPEATAQPDRGKMVKRLSIGSKLTMGFSILVVLVLLVVGLTYFASDEATNTITDTVELRVPAALASARAQANLLRMFADLRGYLVLGERRFIDSYNEAEQAFQADLETLEALSQNFDPDNQQRINDLRLAYEEWQALPPRLFALRDDQMEREPAYRWLNTTGTELSGGVLININQMIEAQARREPTAQNILLLRDMATFQGSYAAMFSGLRGYVTTRNPIFRSYEYEVNRDITEDTWQSLVQNQALLTPEQQALLAETRDARNEFLAQVPDEVFAVLESEQWREDLYLFDSQVQPLTDQMQQLLREITESQQAALQNDLTRGSEGLNVARWQSLVGGLAAVILGIAMAFIFWRIIVGPVRRLTTVAQQIQEGNLTVQARVESGDEIGTFARTFNSMTAQLRQNLVQIRKEKKRADDLLNVVIPIGVALSSEKNFNQLLENMLVQALSFCYADCGALFLRDHNALKLVMLRVTSQQRLMGGTSGIPIELAPLELIDAETGEPDCGSPVTYVACNMTTVNIADIDSADNPFDIGRLKEFTTLVGYRPVSLLALPLKNTQAEVLGVMLLINAQNPETNQIIPFDTNLQQMMESFSSLAVAALESYIREQRLRQEIQQLRIEIDEQKRQQQVSEIVETDFFQDLRAKVHALRQRNQEKASNMPEDASQV